MSSFSEDELEVIQVFGELQGLLWAVDQKELSSREGIQINRTLKALHTIDESQLPELNALHARWKAAVNAA